MTCRPPGDGGVIERITTADVLARAGDEHRAGLPLLVRHFLTVVGLELLYGGLCAGERDPDGAQPRAPGVPPRSVHPAGGRTITSRPLRSSGVPGVRLHHSRDLVHWGRWAARWRRALLDLTGAPTRAECGRRT